MVVQLVLMLLVPGAKYDGPEAVSFLLTEYYSYRRTSSFCYDVDDDSIQIKLFLFEVGEHTPFATYYDNGFRCYLITM